MKLHNLMEEYVGSRVNELYKQISKEQPLWLTCDCQSCRLDVSSYVLNKVHPCYVVSGRGVVYTAQEVLNSQLKADVDALIVEAIRTVSSTQRPNHKILAMQHSNATAGENAFFNFPVISGSVLNGANFEPVADAEIILKNANGIVIMQDMTWSNPTKTFNSTKGSFSFWPQAIPAEKAGVTNKFHFTAEVKAKGFSPVTAGFDIDLTSDTGKKTTINSVLTVKLQDFILFNA